ncbi:hypothetical protein, partial [Nocardioides sp.]|uniref:hypothetical protein n=1 Tax=Nocardioides sp. TaxID=35761 RepID=UPI0025CE40C1
ASNAARVTVAVLPDEFRRIALFPGGGPSPSVWDRLAVADAPPIPVSGTHFGLTLTDSTLRSVLVGGRLNPVTVGLDFEIVAT